MSDKKNHSREVVEKFVKFNDGKIIGNFDDVIVYISEDGYINFCQFKNFDDIEKFDISKESEYAYSRSEFEKIAFDFINNNDVDAPVLGINFCFAAFLVVNDGKGILRMHNNIYSAD